MNLSNPFIKLFRLIELGMSLMFFLVSGFSCDESIFQITPSSLLAWHGSCVVLSCQINEMHNSAHIHDVHLVWYFEPSWNYNWQDYNTTLLYDSSKTLENQTSPAFWGRVRFIGDLARKDCSLMVSHRLFAHINSEVLDILSSFDFVEIESPPEPKIELVPPKIIENVPAKVICTMSYDCPDEPVILTFHGLAEHHLSSQTTIFENRRILTTMIFEPTWEDDGKILSCILRSPNGKEISQSTLKLDVKCEHIETPSIEMKILKLNAVPGTTVQEGEKLSLECNVDGSNPGVTYQWYKDNIVRRWTTDKITFNSAQATDGGSYKCEARNEVGSKTSEPLTIDVQYPPKQTRVEMPYGPFQENSRVTLSCSSQGNPHISHYEWYKNRETQVTGTSEKLYFGALQPGHSGTYYCKAFNSIGNAMSLPVTLDVQYAPKDVQLSITNPQSIKERDTVRLNCSVGSSNPVYRWYKWYKMQKPIENSQQLYTFTALPEKNNVYRCEACNRVGCISSNQVTVDVLFAPQNVRASRSPKGQISEGGVVTLECEVGDSNPLHITFSWYKDGRQLNSSSFSLTIQKVAPSDSGTYGCEAKNEIGTSSSSVSLDVRYGPRNVRLSLQRTDVITEGMDVQLHCLNDANPQSHTYKWYWNGKEMAQEVLSILKLTKIQVEQSGCYRCRVFNTISEGESECKNLSVSYSRSTKLKRILIVMTPNSSLVQC
uniref:B-cell receptor CD22 n=1 Tax=Salvator merianae TaxID=96440 RepID=A0A8D0CCF3_SALMN